MLDNVKNSGPYQIKVTKDLIERAAKNNDFHVKADNDGTYKVIGSDYRTSAYVALWDQKYISGNATPEEAVEKAEGCSELYRFELSTSWDDINNESVLSLLTVPDSEEKAE